MSQWMQWLRRERLHGRGRDPAGHDPATGRRFVAFLKPVVEKEERARAERERQRVAAAAAAQRKQREEAEARHRAQAQALRAVQHLQFGKWNQRWQLR